MIETILKQFETIAPLTPIEIPANNRINKKGMHFTIDSFTVNGYGKISTIKMNAMMGLMKMETLVFTPLQKDMPLLSFDLIAAMGNDTLLLELYDTQINPVSLESMNAVKEKYAELPDNDLGEHWYDYLKLKPTLSKKGKKIKEKLEPLINEWIESYIELLKNAQSCDPALKQKKTADYVDGLLSNGGPSTDQFKKLIGEKETADLFKRYIFFAED